MQYFNLPTMQSKNKWLLCVTSNYSDYQHGDEGKYFLLWFNSVFLTCIFENSL